MLSARFSRAWLCDIVLGGPRALVVGLLVAGGAGHTALAADPASAPIQAREDAAHPRRADFGSAQPSPAARHVADWVTDSGDNLGMPFAIVDKANARVFVFGAAGSILGHAPALLGLAEGDESAPGIGQRKLSQIRPEERTTPAGRFVASLASNLHGEEILWIDYETAISMHRVITSNPKERRAQRLASADPRERRISYGCINVPATFYDKVVSAAFTGTNGIVYVLPESRAPAEVFGSYDVDERARASPGRRSSPDRSPR